MRTPTTTRPELALARAFVRGCRPARVRTMRQFAEQEIELPDGPAKGERFRVAKQPFTGLLFDEIDSGRWSRIVVTGPSQTGKSLIGFVIPGLYHLFELGETVIFGVTEMEMAGDKWRENLRPAIEATRYRELLPRVGEGSRGGNVRAIRFRNGATLRFMSGAGRDKRRAHFTARVLLLTEVDGMDTASELSRESNPIDQMIARTRAFGAAARVYLECTVSIDAGRIWQEYKAGSASRIILPCPHCGLFVTPEREHLRGWDAAEDSLDAEESAHLVCPECQQPWTEDERIAANRGCRLLHRGQEVAPDGSIVGSLPRTRSLGFRWSAVNNLLAPIGLVGAEEWEADRAIDSDAADKKLNQFVWCVPHEPDAREVVSLSVQQIRDRQSPTPQGLVPAWADLLTMGVDLGQYVLHWVLLAGDVARQHHLQVVDYGEHDVHSRQLPVEEALSMALGELAARADDPDQGWPDEHGAVRHPDAVWYDAGWKPTPVYRHCRARGPKHWPAKGYGLRQQGRPRYHAPKTTGSTTVAIYDGFHLARIKHNEVGTTQLYEHDADTAKARVHARLAIPVDEPGAILLPQAARSVEHTTYAKHLLAEQLVEEEGLQTWVPTPGHGGHNHWLDATALALLAMIRRWHGPAQPQPPAGGWYAQQRRRRR